MFDVTVKRYNRELKNSKFWSNIEQFENIKQIAKIQSNMAIQYNTIQYNQLSGTVRVAKILKYSSHLINFNLKILSKT
jgi:hypothetical protein